MGAGEYTSRLAATPSVSAMFQVAPTQGQCRPEPGIFGHSFNSEGLLVASCDGSYKLLSPTMSPTTFTRALCPGDGGVLAENWFNEN